MTQGVFRTMKEGKGYLARPWNAVVLLLFAGLFFLLCFTCPAGASIVRYDVVSGADNLGNRVWGSLYVDPGPSFSENWISYDIVGYSLHSVAFNYIGLGGDIDFLKGPGPGVPGFDEMVPGGSTVHIGDEWTNALAGVLFYDRVRNDVDPTIANYSVLHRYIRVIDLNWHGSGDDAYGLGTFVFRAVWLPPQFPPAPAPVPSALLLLAPGLAGLALLRSHANRDRTKRSGK